MRQQTKEALNDHLKLRIVQFSDLLREQVVVQDKWKATIQDMLQDLAQQAQIVSSYSQHDLSEGQNICSLPNDADYDFSALFKISNNILSSKESIDAQLQGKHLEKLSGVEFPSEIENIGLLIESWNDTLEKRILPCMYTWSCLVCLLF